MFKEQFSVMIKLDEKDKKAKISQRSHLSKEYYCERCENLKIDHQVQKHDYGLSTEKWWCGSGLPIHVYVCDTCGNWSGPWVAAEFVPGY